VTGPGVLDRLTERPPTPQSVVAPGVLAHEGRPIPFDEGGLAYGFREWRAPSWSVQASDAPAAVRLRRLHDAARSGWKALLEESPVLTGDEADLDATHLERTLAEHGGIMSQVCHDPRERLVRFEEVVPPGRARRLSPRTATWLASHAEAWDAVSRTGVTPRVLLAEQPASIVDFYENRLVARLVEHLTRRLRRRHAHLRELSDVEDHGASLRAGRLAPRTLLRLTELWERSWRLEDGRTALDTALQALDRLLREVARMRRLRVYREVPRRRQVDGLRPTNIFTGDRRYRRVAEIWKAWQRDAGATDAQELQSRAAATAEGFDMLVLALVAESVGALGWTRPIGALPQPGGPPSRCTRPEWPHLHIGRDATGAVTVGLGDRDDPLTFVPLGAVVDTGVPEGRALAGRLRRAAARRDGSTVLAHLPSAPTLGPSDDLPAAGRPAVVAVGPTDLWSVERVGRLLRWHLWAPLLRILPDLIEPVADELAKSPLGSCGDWLASGARPRTLLVSGRPDAGRRESFEREVIEPIRQASRQRSKPERDRLRARTSDVVEHLARLDERLRPAFVCPVHGEDHGTAEERRGEAGGLVATCTACGALWGAVPCACGEQIPFVLPGDVSASKLDPGTLGLDEVARVEGDAQDVRVRCHDCKALRPLPQFSW